MESFAERVRHHRELPDLRPDERFPSGTRRSASGREGAVMKLSRPVRGRSGPLIGRCGAVTGPSDPVGGRNVRRGEHDDPSPARVHR